MDSEESMESDESQDSIEIKAPLKPKQRNINQGLFAGPGVLAAGKERCKQCIEPADDLFKCNKNTQHLKCDDCKKLFPERN